MSAFVLERKYALQLPHSYVDIDRDEMEYIDGGDTVGDMAALTAALAACAAVFIGYGALSVVKRNHIASKFGVGIAIFGTVVVISLMAYTSRKVIGNIWGGITRFLGF